MDYEKKYKESMAKMSKFLAKHDGFTISKDGEMYKELSEIFDELKESKDERIWLINYLSNRILNSSIIAENENLKKAIAWLEKQGEQKPADKIQIGKRYNCIASPKYSTFVKGFIYIPEDKFLCSLMNLCSDCFEPIEDVEQKHTDKIEPKFKIEEGKWYVCISQFCNCIEGKVYKATSDSRIIDDFGTEYDMHSDAYKYFRLWTIEDAKDGDVLVASDDSIFLFKDVIYSACKYYVTLTTDGAVKFNEGLKHYWETATAVHPATKEQRDLLFKKMHEAGYEWDAEKLELKQTKNVFPLTEDREMLESIINDVKQRADLESEQIDWLVSLREKFDCIS